MSHPTKPQASRAVRLLVWSIVWLILRAPLPLCHAHAASAAAPELRQHLEAHHEADRGSGWLTWHIHWMSPWELRQCRGLADPEDSPTQSRQHDGSTDVWLAAESGPVQGLWLESVISRIPPEPGHLAAGRRETSQAGRPAGGLLAVHRVCGVRALTGVTLC